MRKRKRVIVTTILGLLCGCLSGYIISVMSMIIVFDSMSKAGKGDPSLFAGLTWKIISFHVKTILFHGLFGFSIGISPLRWHWALHGLVMGGIFGIIMGLLGLFRGYSGLSVTSVEFVLTVCLCFVYGFLIELITQWLSRKER